jgi:hypothetical protein
VRGVNYSPALERSASLVRGVSYSPALKWSALLVLIALTLGLKWVWWVGRQVEPSEKDTQLRVADFLVRQHFSVSLSQEAREGTPTIRATTPVCRMLVVDSPVIGWDRDVVRRAATAADRVFVVFQGRVYPEQPTWRIAFDFLRARLLRGMGVRVDTAPLLTVIATTSCDAERLPWNQLG